MKLKEALENHRGEKVKIGAASSFIFCGMAEDAFEVLDRMSMERLEELFKMLKDTTRKNEIFDRFWDAKTESFLRSVKSDARSKRWDELKTADRMKWAVKECDRKKQHDRTRTAHLLESLPEQIQKFKGFVERRVREEYESIEGGTIILIEGQETGAYWTYEEYEERGTDDKRNILHQT